MHYFPEGARFYAGTALAAAKNVTVATNASPSVVTSAAHGYINGDPLLFTSGWAEADATIYKAQNMTADTVSLLGLDASAASVFPAGEGVGKLQKVTTWERIPQMVGFESSGGDPKFTVLDLMERSSSINIPNGVNPTIMTLTVSHDPDLAGWQTLLGVSRTRSPAPFKIAYPNGAYSYAYGYFIANPVPQIQKGNVNQAKITFAMLGQFTAYGS